MEFRVIIPVRYAASRCPGKGIADIAGKPMMQHVYNRALKSGAESVVIATDNEKVREAAEKFEAHVVMTSEEHTSGTERLAEAAIALGYGDDDIVVNLQCDVPFIPPAVIRQVAEDLNRHDNVKMATLWEPLQHTDEMADRDIVKVVLNKRSYALYFSRADVPWSRDAFPPKECTELGEQHHRHIGIYAYRAGFLQEYVQWEPCGIEQIEKLEQLRALYNGIRIYAGRAKLPVPPGVDTPEQLEEARAYAKKARK